MTNINKENEAIKRVKENKDLEPYFFEKIIERKDPKWFKLLKNNGYMDIENIQYVNGNEYVERWYVLEYIKSILDDVCKNKNYEIVDEVKTLLKEISDKSNNYKVCQQSLEVIYLIPEKLYDAEYLEEIVSNWIKKGNMNIITNLIDLICKLTDKKELENSLIILKIVLADMLSKNTDASYLMFKMNKSIDILCKDDSLKLINIIIELIESYLFVENSYREIDNDKIEIKSNRQYYQIFINGKNLFKDKFYNRVIDIDKIKKEVEKSSNKYKVEEVDRVVKLIYGDLFSKESLKSLYSNDLYNISTFDYIVYLIKNILKENNSNKKIEEIIKYMLNSKYDFIIKLGLYGLNCVVCNYSRLFEEILQENKEIFNYIIRFDIFDEDIKFLFENLKDINERSVSLIDEIIDEEEYIMHDFGNEFNDIWKQKRYNALSHIPYFAKKLEETKKKTNYNAELKPCIEIGKWYTIKEKSLISCNDIKNMSNQELVFEMKKFEPKKINDEYEEISYRGFGIEIKKAIIEEPERFYINLDLFNNISNEFMSYIIDGFKELVEQNKINKVTNIVKLFMEYIEREEFWHITPRHRYSNEVVLKRMFKFLDDYLDNDKIEFNDEIFSYIIKVLNECINNIDYKKYEEEIINNNDYRFYILNSLASLNNQVLLSLALRLKRMDMVKDKDKELNQLYRCILKKCPKNLYLIMGFYVLQLTFINKEWTKSIILNKVDKDDKCYFTIGYLLNLNINKEYFDMMKSDYIEFIEKKYNDKNIKKGLVDHIVIAYINNFDNGYELINKLIDNSDDEIIINIINACMELKKENLLKDITDKDYNKKLLHIWSNINKAIKEKKYEDINKIKKETTKFITKFDEVDDNVKINISDSFSYMTDDFYTYNLILYLNNQIEALSETNNTLEDIIKEFLIVTSPIYPEKEIQKLVKYLFESNKDYIMEIFDSYLDKNKQFTNIGQFIRKLALE